MAEQSRKHLKVFLDVLSLVTNLKFSIHRLVKIVDWTPGLDMRDYIQFDRFPDVNNPYEILNNDILKTVNILMTNSISESISSALRWFSLGVGAMYPDEQFQYFWFALEILAEMEKEPTKVPDKCPKCREPLYCETCKQIFKHRPYPSQAIQQLISKTVQNKQGDVYDNVSKIRHALLHGENIDKKEDDNFHKQVDLLGAIVWSALINSFKKPKGTMLIAPNTYCHRIFYNKIEGKIGCKSGDKHNPQIEDIGGLKVSLQPIERKEDSSEDKHQ